MSIQHELAEYIGGTYLHLKHAFPRCREFCVGPLTSADLFAIVKKENSQRGGISICKTRDERPIPGKTVRCVVEIQEGKLKVRKRNPREKRQNEDGDSANYYA